MNKLSTTVDWKNREIHGIYEVPTFNNHYSAPSGVSAYQFPEDTSFVSISTQSAGVWYRFGSSDITTDIPATTIQDGSSPLYLSPNQTVTHYVRYVTHFSLKSTGNLVLSFWR